jgi:hypothetical protein
MKMRQNSSAHRGAARARGQAATDFLVSYGFALMIVATFIFVVVRYGVFSTRLVPNDCYASPSFLCTSYLLFNNGTFDFVFAQATGGTMNVIGLACSMAVNATGDLPQYGNVNVLGYAKSPGSYPTAQLQNGIIVYSDNASATISTYCYGPSGQITAVPGAEYNGYVWVNYTLSNLPGSYTRMIATFTAKTV